MRIDLGTRKIQRMGERVAFFVTLPLPWLNTYKISKGSIVSLSIESEGALQILPGVVK